MFLRTFFDGIKVKEVIVDKIMERKELIFVI